MCDGCGGAGSIANVQLTISSTTVRIAEHHATEAANICFTRRAGDVRWLRWRWQHAKCAVDEIPAQDLALLTAMHRRLVMRAPQGEPEVCEGCGGAGGVRCFACDGTGVMATSDAELDMSPEAQRRAQKVGS